MSGLMGVVENVRFSDLNPPIVNIYVHDIRIFVLWGDCGRCL